MNVNSKYGELVIGTMNWKNIDKKLEKGLIFLCYVVGIGSILFGSLSGTNYRYHFIIIGVLALVLVSVHATRRAAQYNENMKIQ